MKTIRLLIVEDDAMLLSELKKHYRGFFESQGFDSVTIEQAENATEAKQLAKGAGSNPYDLVSLDVNLGDAEVTGLDVLAAFRRFQSAWMVTLLTGVEADGTLDATVGKGAATKLRKQLRRDAYARFPAERLMVVEKPSSSLPTEEAATLLRNRIQQIALVYKEVGRLRYIFRPIEVTSLERVIVPKQVKGPKQKRQFIETTALHWQIRFNCGDIRTLPDKAGFKTIHKILSLGPDESLTPEAALVVEPEKENEATKLGVVEAVGKSAFAVYFETFGVKWNDLTADKQELLVKTTLGPQLRKYEELRGFQDEDDLSANEADELETLTHQLGVLVPVAEAYIAAKKEADSQNSDQEDSQEAAIRAALQQGQLHIGGAGYDTRPGGWGLDSPERWIFSARKKRVLDYLRENGFADFANHLEDYVQPNRGTWSYNPAGDIEWTT